MTLPMSVRSTAATALVLAAFALTGCAGNAGTTATTDGAPAASTPASAQVLTVSDPWVKATEMDMTAVFGNITNTSDAAVTVESASTSVEAMVMLHETKVGADGASTMQELDGGLPIPAGATVKLEPGGTHIMLMDLKQAIQPGDVITVTLKLSDGTEVNFDATAKEFTGAQETYAPGSTGDMNHG